jgi:hypothetical protein
MFLRYERGRASRAIRTWRRCVRRSTSAVSSSDSRLRSSRIRFSTPTAVLSRLLRSLRSTNCCSISSRCCSETWRRKRVTTSNAAGELSHELLQESAVCCAQEEAGVSSAQEQDAGVSSAHDEAGVSSARDEEEVGVSSALVHGGAFLRRWRRGADRVGRTIGPIIGPPHVVVTDTNFSLLKI